MTFPALCPLRVVTGLDCPLCGASRATVELLQGDVAQALDLNALYVVALPVVIATAAFMLARRRLPTWLTAPRAPALLLTLGLAYAIVRNLPFAPFRYLGT